MSKSGDILDVGDEIPMAAGEFGLAPTNPIPLGSDNTGRKQVRYFSRLRSASGETISWSHVGSLPLAGVLAGRQMPQTLSTVDVFLVNVDGAVPVTMYGCTAFLRDSNKAPRGFVLVDDDEEALEREEESTNESRWLSFPVDEPIGEVSIFKAEIPYRLRSLDECIDEDESIDDVIIPSGTKARLEVDSAIEHLDFLTSCDLSALSDLYLSGTRVTNGDLIVLDRMPLLEALSLNDTKVSDSGLRHVESLSKLRVLRLKNTLITDRGMVFIGKLRKLAYLDIQGTYIFDRGLSCIASINNLKTLVLMNTWISDESLAHLGRQGVELERLYLDHTAVTDFGLVSLESMNSLRFLTLWNSKVTEEGVARLQEALPECKIHFTGVETLERLRNKANSDD